MHHRSIFNSANISMEQGNLWKHRCKVNGFDYVQGRDMKGWLVSVLLLSIGSNETGWRRISSSYYLSGSTFYLRSTIGLLLKRRFNERLFFRIYTSQNWIGLWKKFSDYLKVPHFSQFYWQFVLQHFLELLISCLNMVLKCTHKPKPNFMTH